MCAVRTLPVALIISDIHTFFPSFHWEGETTYQTKACHSSGCVTRSLRIGLGRYQPFSKPKSLEANEVGYILEEDELVNAVGASNLQV